ncbi:colicin E3/pyocin S6 family cytotoxin (plasmid) [Rhizobium leguminosarum]
MQADLFYTDLQRFPRAEGLRRLERSNRHRHSRQATARCAAGNNTLEGTYQLNDTRQTVHQRLQKEYEEFGICKSVGGRARWYDSKGNIYEWDYQHGKLEKIR